MKKIISGLLFFTLFLPLNSMALEYEGNESIYINSPVEDDLYLAGEEVRVRTQIDGDLYAGGNQLIIESQITGDVFAGGNIVTLRGDLNDDVKAVGQSIQIDAKIGGDVILAGENLTVADTSTIGGDFVFAGTKIRLDAPIEGTIRGTGESIYINNEIKENVFIYNSGKITFGPDAKIMGNLTYSSSNKIEIPQGVVAGKVIFKEKHIPSKEGLAGVVAGFSLYGFLSAVFFGLILLGLSRHFLLHNTHRMMESPLKSMGIGFAFLIMTPVASFILMISFIGLPLGFILFGMWLIALYIGTISASMFIGRYLIKVDATSGLLRLLGSFSLGALIFVILGLIPYIGWAIKLILILMALGGFFLAQMDRFKELRKKKLL